MPVTGDQGLTRLQPGVLIPQIADLLADGVAVDNCLPLHAVMHFDGIRVHTYLPLHAVTYVDGVKVPNTTVTCGDAP